MKIVAGGKDTVGDMQRVVQSIPSSYTVWKDGTQAIAESNLKGGTDYTTGTDAVVINNAMAALSNRGNLYIKQGDYGGASITLGQYISATIDVGVANLTVGYHASWTGVLIDLSNFSLAFGALGEIYRFRSWGAGQALHLRAVLPNKQTVLKIIPNGAPSPWTSSFQIFNTDIEADFTNYECLEMTWESNIAYLNTFKGGTGTLRSFQIFMNATPQIHLLADATGAECLRLKVNYRATDPSATELADGWFALYKNTATAAVKLWFNDGGAMKSVALV